MPVYECDCGFSAESATTFHRHLTFFRGSAQETEHYMVPIGEPRRRQPVQPAKLDLRCSYPVLEKAESSPTLPTSTSVGPDGAQFAKAASLQLPAGTAAGLRARVPDGPQVDMLASQICSRLDGNFVSVATPDSLASGEADAAWEAITAGGNDSDDTYAELTRKLQTTGGEPEPSGEWRIAEAFTRTVGRIRESWIGSPPSQSARATAEELVAAVENFSADSLEALLLWQDPWVTGGVYFAGLYFLLVLRQIFYGGLPIQPTTVATALSFLVLVYNLMVKLLRFYLPVFPPMIRNGLVLLPGMASRDTARLPNQEEAIVDGTKQVLMAVTRFLAPILGAVTTCIVRQLRGDKVASSIWLILTLWSIMCFGELRLVDQSAMLMLLWTALFALPPLYSACQQVLDAVIVETLGFLQAVIDGGEKGTLIMAGASGVATAVALDGSLLLRGSLAGMVTAGVLIWRARGLADEQAAAGTARDG